MQIVDGQIVYSATDLNNYIACRHLTSLDAAAVRGAIVRPTDRREQGVLLGRLGAEHEQNYRRQLIEAGHDVLEIDQGAGLRDRVAATEKAMADGAEIIYQATFFDGAWLGYADFLRRVDESIPGARWQWHYEVEDTKLALHTRPYFLLQLCYYTEHVTRVQGMTPRLMHVILGDLSRQPFTVVEFDAYYRSVRADFLNFVKDGTDSTYPLPIDNCALCLWNPKCEQRRKDDDHISLVANITALQQERFEGVSITTLAGLASATEGQQPPKMADATYAKIRRQARLQEEQRQAFARGDAAPYKYEFIEDALTEGRGLSLLPAPSPGDVFFDMEGDPYYEIGTGLEYLFGIYTPDGSSRAFWGCDRTGTKEDRRGEKEAFERLIDFVMERRAQDSQMHIYHYASYERSALQKLSLRHATRENDLDILLKEERFVDLYRVVRQALVVGQPGYSLKKIEEIYQPHKRSGAITSGDESMLRFEEWLSSRESAEGAKTAILDDIEHYNSEDCASTFHLREWLLSLRTIAARDHGCDIPFYARAEAEDDDEKKEAKYDDLRRRLEAHLPTDFDLSDERYADALSYFMTRHMLDYHWREAKPVYWRFHDRCETYQEDPLDLDTDSECITGLEFVSGPEPIRRSEIFTLRFPMQLHKLGTDKCFSLEDKEPAGEIIAIEDGERYGTLKLERGPSLKKTALPSAITIRNIVPSSSVLAAIARFGEALDAEGPACHYRAAFDVLTKAFPRLRDRQRGARVQPSHVDEQALSNLCDMLDDSYLFIQGPPGSGKTYYGARIIVRLLARGLKVGVTANSHKAIHNLLDEVEKVAAERDVAFRGLKKSNKDGENEYHGPHFDNDEKSLARADVDLFAGTAWAFGIPAMDQTLDYIFIEEAGQMALPAAMAVMTAARNVVMLGDPLQLSHVTHTDHPGDIGASVLEHLLDEELRPVSVDRGVLLTDSFRMHPDVCGFISELLYEGRLRSAEHRDQQHVDSHGLSGTGLRYIPVEHALNTQSSLEEAKVIADEVRLLLDGSVTDFEGRTRKLTPSDIIVVTPYNAQIRCIKRELERYGKSASVEVGTVDNFQGREAFVVFYSTAASSPQGAARGVSFIFDRQRFNVAISRARALAILVGSPKLFLHDCSSVEDVRIANGVYRFLEGILGAGDLAASKS
ncbi:MAG: TM0106 family RecB-like putative nuclease [Vulcanimicrobiaceae bacterium]|jgi:uncharacterized protein